ncbi:MAG: hypothetical protein PUG32_06095, partial [Bacteroidales bacterium]|nr:hypothetical protein [Bacteroidales bacterium]
LRARGAKQYTPFSSADLLYLLMPDRFANGNTANDDDATLNHPVKSTALSFKNNYPCQKHHYFIARIRAGFSLVLHSSLLGLTD